MGKGWAKGLTATTDARIAAMAAAHRGMRYVRRTAVEQCKWPGASWTTLPLAWSDEMAYVVGLIATDGCLLSGRRQINFKARDRSLVRSLLKVLGRTNKIREERTRRGGIAYVVQFGDVRLYEWLMEVGLTPRKSLTLGAIPVPAQHLAPLVRGLLDGDGSILNYRYEGTGKARGTYEALRTCFVSASRPHIEWLRAELRSAVAIQGSIGRARRFDRTNDVYRLAYANRESEVLLPWLYANVTVPWLHRKKAIWERYAARRIG